MRGLKTIPMPQRNGRGPDNSTIEKAMDIRLDACSVHCISLTGSDTAVFSAIFFNHSRSYIFAPAFLDVHHLNSSMDIFDFCGVAVTPTCTFV